VSDAEQPLSDVERRQLRFDGLRLRAAATLNLPVDAERVTVQASQHLVFESLVSGFIATGKVPDLGAFVRLSETIVATTPDPPPAPIDLKIEVVGRKDSTPTDKLSPADATPETNSGSTPPADGATFPPMNSPPADRPKPSLREMARRDRGGDERRYFRPKPASEADQLRAAGIELAHDLAKQTNSEHWLKRNQTEPHPTRGGSAAPAHDDSPAMNKFVGAFRDGDGQQLGVRQSETHHVLNPTDTLFGVPAADLKIDTSLPTIKKDN